MAAYFVVGATLDIAAHQPGWEAVLSGGGTPLDWLHAVGASALLGSAVLFVLGHGVGVIARLWIAFSVIQAATSHTFWFGGPATVVQNAGPFLADMAIAASLLLYLSFMDRSPPAAATNALQSP